VDGTGSRDDASTFGLCCLIQRVTAAPPDLTSRDLGPD
jgi:hypothetical protein